MTPDPEVLSCPACGRENPVSHKFCGMCGATLTAGPRLLSDAGERESGEGHSEEKTRPEPQPFEHSITNPNELSLFRSFRPSDSSDEGYWEEESRSPYRIYVAVVIALMIAGLAYMAWRTAKSGAQNANQAPPAPVSAEKSPAPAPPSTSEASAPKSAEPSANSPAPATAPKKTEMAKEMDRAPASAKSEVNTAGSTPPDNGSAELAQARRYLGTQDGAEASKWLWKSVAKHNGQATVLLADLYLKGEGVSKNCDQARVLLDSAARKGVAGAGERLRNLQAFGCQ